MRPQALHIVVILVILGFPATLYAQDHPQPGSKTHTRSRNQQCICTYCTNANSGIRSIPTPKLIDLPTPSGCEWRTFESSVDLDDPSIAVYGVDRVFYVETDIELVDLSGNKLDTVELDGVVTPGLGVELSFGEGGNFLPFSLFAEVTTSDFDQEVTGTVRGAGPGRGGPGGPTSDLEFDLLQIRTGLRYRALSYRCYDEETGDVTLELFADLALGAAWFRIEPANFDEDTATAVSGFLELRAGLRGEIFRGVDLYFAVGGEGHAGGASGFGIGGLAGVIFDF